MNIKRVQGYSYQNYINVSLSFPPFNTDNQASYNCNVVLLCICIFHYDDKNTLQATLGRVTIQIDKVVTEGVYSGLFNLNHDSNKDGSRKLEIEIMWSNRLSHDSM